MGVRGRLGTAAEMGVWAWVFSRAKEEESAEAAPAVKLL